MDLAIVGTEHWAFRFTVMITLSVIVAVMGLWLDSAAVVIGAMLLAPLMQPVLATGACISMALFTKALFSFLKVSAATAWCIFLAYALSRLLPDTELTGEILSRTRPDIKDLIVALAAGTAGAYATVREDASASLPGVAVAVALVPPLGAVGIALEAGDLTRASGAMLLYVTNLAAIILASIFVFVATGFVPTRRLLHHRMRMAFAVLAVALAVVVLSVRLYGTFQDSIRQNENKDRVEAVVDDWLNGTPLTRTVELSDDLISVILRGTAAPPDQSLLQSDLGLEFPERRVLVEWIRTEQATTTTTVPMGEAEQLQEDVTVAVESWLDGADIDYQIDRVTVDGETVRVDAAGTGEPPPLSDLGDALAAIDPALSPRINWVSLETITPGDDIPTPLELDRANLEAIVSDWATRRDYVVRDMTYDGELVLVEVAGRATPSAVALERLEDRVAEVNPDAAVELYFTARRQVTTTTSTTTTTTAAGSASPTTTAGPTTTNP